MSTTPIITTKCLAFSYQWSNFLYRSNMLPCVLLQYIIRSRLMYSIYLDHGGPLMNGDIEEMGGKITVKCPWHAYHIAIETGEGLYRGVDMAFGSDGKLQPTSPRVKSKGVKQRTHFVKVHQQEIYVADSSQVEGTPAIESDVYALEQVKIPDQIGPPIHSRMK